GASTARPGARLRPRASPLATARWPRAMRSTRARGPPGGNRCGHRASREVRMAPDMRDPQFQSVSRDELTPLVFLERTVRVFPDKTAVVYGDFRRSWAEFAEDVGRFAGALVRAGVAPGDRVAVLAPNVPALLAAHFAVLLVRVPLVAIHTRLTEAEVGYPLDHSGAVVVIAAPDPAPRVADAPGGLRARPKLVNLED